jgi:hypothetical protein
MGDEWTDKLLTADRSVDNAHAHDPKKGRYPEARDPNTNVWAYDIHNPVRRERRDTTNG